VALVCATAGFLVASPFGGVEFAHAIGSGEAEEAPMADIILPLQRSRDDGPYYFYHGRNFGSESLVNPIRLIINGGFGITQLENRDNRITEIDYETGWRNVWRNVGSPIAAIEVHGWSDFFQREIIPVSVNSHNAQYWPNYMQHLFGGGMSYRMYSEWYRYHGYPSPRLMSGATMAVYHLLNEVVENDGYVGYRTDPIADLYVFDPLSIVLFSSDRATRFFAETLHMADWSYQPSINPADGRLENNGQNFAMKLDLPWFERWQLFYHFGTHGEGGLSYKVRSRETVSVAAGLAARDLLEIAEGVQTVSFGVAGGIFYDRDNSLLASLLFARSKDARVRLNVYPGWLGFGRFAPGFWVADGRETGVVMGVTLNFPTTLPLGLAGGM
jgi:hypothetical protein